MSKGVVARRYASALFEVASDSKQIDLIEEELVQVGKVINDNPAFYQFLHHPQISKETKKEEFRLVFEGKLSETSLNFIDLLLDNNRLDALELIPEYFIEQANEARGLVDAIVTSVHKLSDEEKRGLEESFKKLLNKKIRVQNEVDSSIMGGVVVQIGDRLYDGSVQGKLNRFQQNLKQTQVR
jgi:F-type H+-transporting ATPase subunit delta